MSLFFVVGQGLVKCVVIILALNPNYGLENPCPPPVDGSRRVLRLKIDEGDSRTQIKKTK